jgi:hypothetical protein
MLSEVHRLVGNVDYLNPYDTTGAIDESSEGYNRLVTWLNLGLRRFCNAKVRDGRILRFRALEEEMPFTAEPITGQVMDISGKDVTVMYLPQGDEDAYYYWVAYDGSSAGLVGQSSASVDVGGDYETTLTIYSQDYTPPSVGEDITLYPMFFPFVRRPVSGNPSPSRILVPSTTHVVNTLSLKRLYDIDKVYKGSRDRFEEEYMLTPGEPDVYWDEGSGVMFNCPVEEATDYKVRYIREPKRLVNQDDEPEIPEVWHELIMKYAVWYGYHQLQDFTGAYAHKRDWQEMVDKTVLDQEREHFDDQEAVYLWQ